MRRAVFLDRDGVLLDHNGSVFPGVRVALDRLKDAGFLLVVVTNQPDIAAGTMDKNVLHRVHVNLSAILPLDDIKICPHDDAAKCACRKPNPGMLLSAAKEHDIDISRSYIIGDRWRDISAGTNAGCQTVLVGTGYGEPFPTKPQHRVADLDAAATLILESA